MPLQAGNMSFQPEMNQSSHVIPYEDCQFGWNNHPPNLHLTIMAFFTIIWHDTSKNSRKAESLTASTWSISTNQESWEKVAFVPGYIRAGTMIMIPKRSQKWLIAKQEAFFWDPTNFNIPTSCVLHVEWKWSFSPAVPDLRFSHRLPPNFRASPLGAPTCCARDWSSPALPHSQASWAWLCGSGRRNNGELRRAVGLRKSFAVSFTTTFDSEYLRYRTQKYCKLDDHVLTGHKDGCQFSLLRSCNTTHFKLPTTYTTSSLVSIISLTCGGLNKRDLVHFFIHPKKQKW